MIPAIAIVGHAESGKTALIEQLIRELQRRGRRVAAVKHAHQDFDLDRPGKDSYEIRAAGAAQTLLASDERWALQAEQAVKGRDPDLVEMLGRFAPTGLDLILVEGFKHAAYPKIEVYRAAHGRPPLYPDDPDILAVATDLPLPEGASPQALSINGPEVVVGFILGCLAQGLLR